MKVFSMAKSEHKSIIKKKKGTHEFIPVTDKQGGGMRRLALLYKRIKYG